MDLFTVLLGLHLLGAIVLVGGSLFIWLVAVPASRTLAIPEAKRAILVGELGRRFGPIAIGALVVLILTGLGLALLRLGTPETLLTTVTGRLLLLKGGAVIAVVVLMLLHNVVLAPRLSRAAKANDEKELARIRRISRPVAYAGVGMMIVAVLLGLLVRAPP